ncbi:site-specific integrase [Snuella lapsa]|uniref:site-specific integrase n=1 Tax=Snuella lapsa TaxID=870481 RepID=UPI0031E9A002
MRSNNTFAIIFFSRKSRSNSNFLNIYCRITVEGKRSEISLKRSIPVNNWDVSKGKARGLSTEIRAFNNYLDSVYSKILNCHKQLLEEDKLITSQAIKARYLGIDDVHKTLRELIAYHNDTMTSVLKFGTLKNYYTTERYLHKFLKEKLKQHDIYLKQLNYRFLCDFEQFLRTHKNKKGKLTLSNNGVMKHIERFKKMVNLATKMEWISKNPFVQFQLKFEKFDRQYLTERELKLIENTYYQNDRLEKIKDCFLFACYTGLSYIDAKELNKDQIVKGIDNRYWIFTKREKTNQTVKIPILPKAQQIIEKYKQHPDTLYFNRVLPLCSNQKANKYLREIVDDCKINKKITFHVARHTFATTVMLSNGVPIETVSKLLGHTKLTTTQIYARVIETKISEDIESLLQRLETKKQKQSLVN